MTVARHRDQSVFPKFRCGHPKGPIAQARPWKSEIRDPGSGVIVNDRRNRRVPGPHESYVYPQRLRM